MSLAYLSNMGHPINFAQGFFFVVVWKRLMLTISFSVTSPHRDDNTIATGAVKHNLTKEVNKWQESTKNEKKTRQKKALRNDVHISWDMSYVMVLLAPENGFHTSEYGLL